jgi:hypothetical protein
VTDLLHQRVREMRARVLARTFEYRQRRHARGAWFRLRRALALAREVYAVPRGQGERLVSEGYPADPVGAELAPPKLIVRVPADRIATLKSARPMAVRLDADLLAAECLALVPFEDARPVG